MSSSVSAPSAVQVYRGYTSHLPLIRHLIEKTHEKGGPPGMSAARTIKILEQSVLDGQETGHYLLIAITTLPDVGYIAEGYLWAEIMEAGDLWIHQVYSGSNDTSQELYRVAESMAKAAGLHRMVGYAWRGKGFIRAYTRRWGIKVIGHIIAKDLDHG